MNWEAYKDIVLQKIINDKSQAETSNPTQMNTNEIQANKVHVYKIRVLLTIEEKKIDICISKI